MRNGQWWSKGRRTDLTQCERSCRSFLRNSANARTLTRQVRKNTAGLYDYAKANKHGRKQKSGARLLKALRLFGPVEGFLVNLYLKTEKCICLIL